MANQLATHIQTHQSYRQQAKDLKEALSVREVFFAVLKSDGIFVRLTNTCGQLEDRIILPDSDHYSLALHFQVASADFISSRPNLYGMNVK